MANGDFGRIIGSSFLSGEMVDPYNDPEIQAAIGKIVFAWGEARQLSERQYYDLARSRGFTPEAADNLRAILGSTRHPGPDEISHD